MAKSYEENEAEYQQFRKRLNEFRRSYTERKEYLQDIGILGEWPEYTHMQNEILLELLNWKDGIEKRLADIEEFFKPQPEFEQTEE